MISPVVLFVFNRPEHTEQTLKSLFANKLIDQTEVFVYHDGPRSKEDISKIEEVREVVKRYLPQFETNYIPASQNQGLAASIIKGVGEMIARYGKVIVLEDDMITSPYFLSYMNDGLDKYQNEEKVISIHAYCYPLKPNGQDYFFLKGADCWGWATWKRGWDLFETNGQKLLSSLEAQNKLHEFDFNGKLPYSEMLQSQIAGTNDSWAIRWYASAFLQDKLTLYSSTPFVHNIGNDGSGRHADPSHVYDVQVRKVYTGLPDIPIQHSKYHFDQFGKSGPQKSYLRKIYTKISSLLIGKSKKSLTK